MIIFSLENVILKEKESSCTKSPCISRGLRLLLRPKFEGSYFCRLRDPELLFSAMVHSISHPLGDKMMKDLSQLGFHWKSHTNMRNVILHFGHRQHRHHIPLLGVHATVHFTNFDTTIFFFDALHGQCNDSKDGKWKSHGVDPYGFICIC